MNGKKGFTLFELLMAIVIIGALLSFVLGTIKDNKEELKEGVANIKEILNVTSEDGHVSIKITTKLNEKRPESKTVSGGAIIECEHGDGYGDGRSVVFINKEKFYFGEKDSYGDIKSFPCYQLKGVLATQCQDGESVLYVGNRKFYLGHDDGWGDLNPIPCDGGK